MLPKQTIHYQRLMAFIETLKDAWAIQSFLLRCLRERITSRLAISIWHLVSVEEQWEPGSGHAASHM
jgi:hypothetical protein